MIMELFAMLFASAINQKTTEDERLCIIGSTEKEIFMASDEFINFKRRITKGEYRIFRMTNSIKEYISIPIVGNETLYNMMTKYSINDVFGYTVNWE